MSHIELNNSCHTDATDPVLAMLGVGKQIWQGENADQFQERMRSEDPPEPPALPSMPHEPLTLQDLVWQRIQAHQGDIFATVRGYPFTYEVDGAGLWFTREGRRINRRLTRKQLNVALDRCPIQKTTEIKDLFDYAYLFALLRDSRIRQQAW